MEVDPIKQQALELCWKIEAFLPASEEQAEISIMASDLYHQIVGDAGKMSEVMDPTDEEAMPVEDMDPDFQAAYYLRMALETLEKHHTTGGTGGTKAMRWQTAMYDLEKVIAYFDYWIFRAE